MSEQVFHEELLNKSQKILAQRSLGELSTLRKDIHDLVENILPDQEPTGIAETKPIYDEHGNVVDFQFCQNDVVATLKEKFPGDYTIQPTHYSKAECEANPELYGKYRSFDNTLYYNENEQDTLIERSDTNLTLLHEAGHATDECSTHAISVGGLVDLLRARFTMQMITQKKEALQGKRDTMSEQFSIYQTLIQEQPIPTQEKEQLLIGLVRLVETLAGSLSPDEVDQFERAQKKQLIESSLLLERRDERTAWAYALHALRTYRQKGVNLYTGTLNDLFSDIDKSLGTRHDFYAVDNSPTPRFTKRQNH